MTEARIAVRTVLARWLDAMERGDVEAALSVVTEDVVLKAPGSPAVRGKGALRVGLAAFHEQFSETVSHAIDEIEVAGDWAYAQLAEEVVLRPKAGGEPVTLNGVHLAIFRRDRTGTWRLARDVSSLNHPPPG